MVNRFFIVLIYGFTAENAKFFAEGKRVLATGAQKHGKIIDNFII
jgi:hypothetical protein